MDSITSQNTLIGLGGEPPRGGISGWVRKNRMFLLVVIVPSLIVSAYYLLAASDQYESEAHFIVRSQQTPSTISGLGQALSLIGGPTPDQSESMSVADYLTSHDAVASLRKYGGFVERFHRSDIDPLSRLWSADPKDETLLKYYRRQVDVHFDTATGITTLKVRAFKPSDSYAVISQLIHLGEARVNTLNQRAYSDSINVASRQLALAESALSKTQHAVTAFRQSRNDISPTESGEAQLKLVSGMTQTLAQARAQLNSMNGSVSPSSPQYRALSKRVAALQAQISAQSSRLVGSKGAIANDIGDYEGLLLRQEFASKRYATAAASLAGARDLAMKQQLFIVRVVEPNLPVKSTYPHSYSVIGTVLFCSLLLYAIGWLIAAGVKEHAA